MRRKDKEDISHACVDPKNFAATSIFARKDNLDMAFLDVGLSYDRLVLIPDKDEKDLH